MLCCVKEIKREFWLCRSSKGGKRKMAKILDLKLGEIRVGDHEQRLDYALDEIEGLAKSIERVGLLYPIVVRAGDEGYIVVEGHRRLRACKKLGWETITCSVQEGEGKKIAETAFAGNFHRKELSDVELAGAMKDAHENGGLEIADLAKGFDKSEHWVRGMLAIMNWPGDVQQVVHRRIISLSAARNIALVEDETYREHLLRTAVENGATARTTAAWLQGWRSMAPVEEVVVAAPEAGTREVQPLVPQVPCFCCATVFNCDEVSHVPICFDCVKIIRKAGGL